MADPNKGGQHHPDGYITFHNPLFIAAINANYASTPISVSGAMIPAIQNTVNKIVAAGLNPATVQWGLYQQVIMPQASWPGTTYQEWVSAVGKARTSLGNQQNNQVLNGVTPPTKVALLDLAVQTCFTAHPPIQIIIAVTQQPQASATAAAHDIGIVFGPVNGVETLSLTMICPYGS
jgi:hypothetical protein